MTPCKNLLRASRNLLYLLAGMFLGTNATVELIFGPILTLKLNSMHLYRTESAEAPWTFFYGFVMSVQVLNILASLCLFSSVLFTGYQEKLLSYGTLSIVSVCLSVSLVLHRDLISREVHRDRIEKDMYLQMAKVADLQCSRYFSQCSRLDVARWHQANQCCGWDSVLDLLPQPNRNRTRLPPFCCFTNVTFKHSCSIAEIHRFNEGCKASRDSFLHLPSMALLDYSTSWICISLKVVAALAYAFIQKQSPIPLSEGLFSRYLVLH